MLLENLKIDPNQLPQIEARSFEGLEEDYLYYRITGRSLFFLFAAGFASLFSLFGKVYFWYWLGPILSLFLISIVYELLSFKWRGFCLRELDVSYRSGLIVHRMVTIPLTRVQHCEYSQGLIGRLFDLAQVKVYTAGGSNSDLVIKGLRKNTAIKLRDQITKMAGSHD